MKKLRVDGPAAEVGEMLRLDPNRVLGGMRTRCREHNADRNEITKE